VIILSFAYTVAPRAWGIRDSHLLRSDVKARHDRMVELVERMMSADSLQLTAHGPQIIVTQQAIPNATPFQIPTIVDSRL